MPNNIEFDNTSTATIRLKSAIRDLSGRNKKIAEFALKNPKFVSENPIAETAKKLDVAPSTIYQFVRKLGYKGYQEFKVSLLAEYFNPEISIHERIFSTDKPIDIARKVFEANIKTLDETKKILNTESIEKASNLVVNAQSLVFLGLGGSNAVAFDAYHKFMRTPIHVQHEDDFHLQLMRCSQLSPKDCVILISHTGSDEQAIMLANLCKKYKAKLVVITAYPSSTLAKLADVSLFTSSEETAYRSESLSSRLAQLSLIDTLYVITMFKLDSKDTSMSLNRIRDAIATTRE